MNFFDKIKKVKTEDIFFCFLLIYSLCTVWKYDFYFTQDGPSHFYNSSLLNFYDKSDFLKIYFEKNTLLLPNYTDHIILQYLLKWFNVFFAHKVFLSIIVLFVPITFRYAVKKASNNEGNSNYLIFPFLFNFLLHMGFYNFNLAFIFFNLQIILFFTISNSGKKFQLVLFSFLFILNSIILFYTHGFVFGLSLIVLFLLITIKYYKNFKQMVLKGVFFLFLCLPALILFFLFNKIIHIPNFDVDLSDFQKFEKLIFCGPLLNYIKELEAPYAGLISILAIILISYIITQRNEFVKQKNLLKLPDVFLVLSITIIPFLFYSKNGMLSGMLSDRLAFLFFYLLFFWIASNPINNLLIKVGSFLIILFSFINLVEIRHKTLKQGSIDVTEAIKTSSYIKNRSVVYGLNLLEVMPIYAHFASFLGLNKEVVVCPNYEAELGWFPFKWRKDIKPIRCELNNKNVQLPDYIFVYGNFNDLNKPENLYIKLFIEKACKDIYNSSDGLTKLYIVDKNKTNL